MPMHEGGDEGVMFQPYLSTIAESVLQNPIRKVAQKMQATPGCLSLAGGRPPKDVFPPSVLAWDDESLMNYGPALASGSAPLKAWARELVERFHSPPRGLDHRDVLLTSGNTDGMAKAVMLLTDPGDVVLADEVTYPGIQASALPLGRRVLGVGIDEHGMVPERLEATLGALGDTARARVLYLTPHGGNPTGITLPEDRKDALYAVAREHGLVILEDDPYFFLQIAPREPGQPLEEASMPGTEAAPRSLLSRDTDGRVVRLESFSKIIAPGYRLGWVTGPKALMAKWHVLGEVLTWSVSGVQQKSLLELLRGWGQDGLHRHLQQLQCTYAKRCRYLIAACERHLGGLCRWSAPRFGMFVWLEVLGCASTGSIAEDLISSSGVAMVPGDAFRTAEGASDSSASFFRLSFSLLTEETADLAMSRLRSFLLSRREERAGIQVKRAASDQEPQPPDLKRPNCSRGSPDCDQPRSATSTL